MVALLIAPHAHTLEPGDFLGLFAVRAALDVSGKGAARRKNALKLQAGVNIGVNTVAVVDENGGIIGLEPRSQNHAAGLEGDGFVLLLVIDGVSGTGLGAQAAVPRQEMDAVVPVDGGGVGHRLGIEAEDVAPVVEALVKLSAFGYGGFAADFTDIGEVAGGANELAGPAGAAHLGKLSERSDDLPFGAPVYHADGAHPLDFKAHANTLAA